MLKWFNKKKKDNKGFTLVELIIVVAILAILVGLLAPQYTKYVEKSRKAADVSNLDSLVQGFKVAAADQDFDIKDGAYRITISKDGTMIQTNENGDWQNALKEYTGYAFEKGVKNPNIKLKSKKWNKADTWSDNESVQLPDKGDISARLTIGTDGSVVVQYAPKELLDISNKTPGQTQ